MARTRPYKMPQGIEIRQSPGKGRGVFATRAIKRGEVIEVAPAVVVPTRQDDELIKTFLEHYLFQSDDGTRYVVGLGYASLINHGDRPNAEFFVDIDRITIKATRAIQKNAEVTVDYGWTAREWATIGIETRNGQRKQTQTEV